MKYLLPVLLIAAGIGLLVYNSRQQLHETMERVRAAKKARALQDDDLITSTSNDDGTKDHVQQT